MSDDLGGSKLEIDNETAELVSTDDSGFDTLDEAVAALRDDSDLTEEDNGEREQEANRENGETDEELNSGNDDETLIILDDGKHISLDELKRSYSHNSDDTHKVEKIEQDRKDIEANQQAYATNVSELQTLYHKLTQFLETLIPAEPNLTLVKSDPAEYQYQVALRTNALAELQHICDAKQDMDQMLQRVGDEDIAQYRDAEAKKLIEALPILKETGRRAVFDEENKKTAYEFGFREQEIDETFDNRILQLVHYARIGKIAEQNRKNASRRIAEKPRKSGISKPAISGSYKNRDAMKRLNKIGSLEAAMAVDFE